MKTSTVVFLTVIISWSNIEVDAFFSFNFSGGIYPAFILGRGYSLQQKYNLRNYKLDDVSHRSHREHVNTYDLPAYFSKSIVNGTGFDDSERPQTRNYGSHHRNHRHQRL